MKEYLTHWQFWVAVVLVAVTVNYVWTKVFGKQGKLA